MSSFLQKIFSFNRYDTFTIKSNNGNVWNWYIVSILFLLASFYIIFPWISGKYTIPWDAKAHFQAQFSFLAHSLHDGQSPFWTPYVFSGHPQIADPQSLIFSLPYLLLALFFPSPSFLVLDSMAFAMLIFGGFGVLCFAKDHAWHPAAAIIAALAFAFGSSAAWRIQHIGQIHSLAFFPWGLWMLDRSLRSSSIKWGAGSGFFSAMMVLGPNQVSFLGLLVLFGFVVNYWLAGDNFRIIYLRERFFRSLKPLSAGAIIGAIIVILPVMLTLGFAEDSNRSHIGLDGALLGSLHPSHFLSFVIANLFGTIGPSEQFWGAPSGYWPYIVQATLARNMCNVYQGILPFIGIFIWITSNNAYRRENFAISILFFMMIAYALGRYTPFYNIVYYAIPGVDLFRRPADATFLIGAIGAYLAGFGLDAILRADKNIKKTWFKLIIISLVLFAAGMGMIIWLNRLNYAIPAILTAIITLLVSSLVLFVGMYKQKYSTLFITCIFTICLTADLAYNIRPNDSTALPPEYYAELSEKNSSEIISILKKKIVQNETRRDRVELTGLGFAWPNVSLVQGFENVLGYNPLRFGEYSTATGAQDHVGLPEQRKFSALMPGYRSNLAKLLGLRFIATGVEIEKIDPSLRDFPLKLLAHTKEGFLYENPDVFDRVMIVPNAVSIDQDYLLRTGKWPSTDFNNTIFIEPEAPIVDFKNNIGGKARIIRYENTRIDIEVEVKNGGILLLNDPYHPWWFAEIDGKKAQIYRANGIFRALILTPGAKKVVFKFEPLHGLWDEWL